MDITAEQQADITLALKTISKKRNRYRKYYKYFSGDHPLNFASKKYWNEFARRLQKLTDNMCKIVVNAPVSRLELINFAMDEKDVSAPAWDIWKRNKLPLNAKQVHREAFRTGESYVIVWPDADNKARIFTEDGDDCHTWTDEYGNTAMAAKVWKANDGRFQLTLYYPDRIEKYVSKSKGVTALAAEDSNSTIGIKVSGEYPASGTMFQVREVDGEPFPLPNEYGIVPVFRFTNNVEAESLLDDVIPLQDALNKTLCDLMVGSEFNALRQRWTTGIEYDVDEETGKKIIPFDRDSMVWGAQDPEGKFGSFADMDLEKVIKQKESIVRDICLVSGIPPHYFNLDSSTGLSGDALDKLEARFTSLVEDSQLGFGETWSKVVDFGLTIEDEKQGDNAVEAQWKAASPVSRTQALSNALIEQQLGVDDEIVLSDLGYTDDQIKQSLEAKRTKADEVARQFNAGQDETSQIYS